MLGSFDVRSVACCVLAMAAGGCFEDSGSTSSDDGNDVSSGAADDGDGTDNGDNGDTGPLAGSTDDSDDASDSGTTSSADDTAGTSEPTDGGETTEGTMPPAGLCDCPDETLLCAQFETGLKGWILDAGGATAELPELSSEVKECDAAALRTTVAAESLYSRAAYEFAQGEVGETVRLRTLLHMGGKCIDSDGALTQALDLALFTPGGTFVYRVAIWLQDGGGVILFTGGEKGQGGLTAEFNSSAIVSDNWFELELEIDFAPDEPRARAFVDGEFVVMGDGYPSDAPLDIDALEATLNLGPLQELPFAESCVFHYDTTWVASPAPR